MAAENAVHAAQEPRGLAASMRPRRMAAENPFIGWGDEEEHAALQ